MKTHKNITYGYMDESGAPGVAKNTHDYFLVSIILFSNIKILTSCAKSINNLKFRLKLPDNYEFHRKKNSPKIRSEFEHLLSSLNFSFVTIAIKKDDFRNTATYRQMAQLVIENLSSHAPSIKLIMDINPLLHQELIKQSKFKKSFSIRIAEVKSHKEPLLQLADYVANICHGKLKNNPKSKSIFAKIAKNQLTFYKK